MYLSLKERDTRFVKVREALKKEGIDALIVAGTNNIGGGTGTGSFRYLTDFFIIFYYGLVVFFREYPPLLLLCSELQKYWAKKYSWIEDVQASSNLAEDAARVILQRKQGRERIGIVGLESLSFKAYQDIKKNLPSTELVPADKLLHLLRETKSQEEINLLKTAAEINDEAYNHLCQKLHAGMREHEVIGIIEGYQRQKGIDKCFNLICSEKFPGMTGTSFFGLPWYPSPREIESGDSVLLEITGGYGGYWNQLVRMINVGKKNQEAIEFCGVAAEAIEAGRQYMWPGHRTFELVEAMEKYSMQHGFQLKLPMGHFVGLDLVEDRVSPGCEIELKEGTTVIIHPSIAQEMGPRVLWGETYLVSAQGSVRLNSTSDDYRTV